MPDVVALRPSRSRELGAALKTSRRRFVRKLRKVSPLAALLCGAALSGALTWAFMSQARQGHANSALACEGR
jgi:hypothetical protein